MHTYARENKNGNKANKEMLKGKLKKILNITLYTIDIIATIIALVFILNFNKPADNDNLYMMQSTIVDVTSSNIVVVETVNGDIFEFKGNGTWLVKDSVVLLMDNNGTDDVKDDKIIDVNYNMN